jgi:hypothetical protein
MNRNKKGFKGKNKGGNKNSKVKKKIRKSFVEPSQIKNKQRRRMLVVKKKMMKNKEDILFKMEKRKLEANGQVFEKFTPITQEEKGFSVFKDSNQILTEKAKIEEDSKVKADESIQEEDKIDLEEDLEKEIENDEFSDFINGKKEPKIFLTTMFRTVTRKSYLLLQGILLIL